MPHATEDLPPPHRNGTSNTVDVSDNEDGDRRLIYFIVGGILLAFSIGLTMLIVALATDWQ